MIVIETNRLITELWGYRAGATRRLPRLINKAIAKDMVLTGRRVEGREAESLGKLISRT